jgi:hypothetical protein
MAAPHVSASVALMIANKQTNIRERLHQTALDLGTAGKDAYFGYGRVVAKPAVLGEDVLAPAITFLEPKNTSEVPSLVTIKLDVQDEFTVVEATLFVNNTVIATWTEAPYTFEWNASSYLNQEVILVASAVDDSGNVGAAQITVKVVDEVTPSPSPTPSASPISQKAGQSGGVRQDAGTPAQEYRQDSYRAPQELPPVTNLNQRNPQPVEQPASQTQSAPMQDAQQEQEQQPENPGSRSQGRGGNPNVQGAATEDTSGPFSSIKLFVRRLLGI